MSAASEIATLKAMIADLTATVATLKATPAATPRVVDGPADGRRFPCTATPACSAMTRSKLSAASHDGAQPHWHAPRDAEGWAALQAARAAQRATK